MTVRVRYAGAAGLLLLSILRAVEWLLPDLLPRPGPSFSLPLDQGILFAAFAGIALVVARMRRLPFPRGRQAWAAMMTGVGLFVVPAAAAAFARGWISNFDQVAMLCLTPVFAAVLEPHIQDAAIQESETLQGGKAPARAALPASVAAVAGVLYFFPLETPGTVRAGIALAVFLVVALGLAAAYCLAVRLARGVPEQSIVPMAALAGGTAAVCFLAAAVAVRGAGSSGGMGVYVLRLLLLDLPGLFLLFWLLRRLAASRLTAGFLLAPLLASLAGLAVERMLPPLGSFAGLVLLAGGAGWLLFAPGEEGGSVPSPGQPDGVRTARGG